jgi:hypothetical protein
MLDGMKSECLAGGTERRLFDVTIGDITISPGPSGVEGKSVASSSLMVLDVDSCTGNTTMHMNHIFNKKIWLCTPTFQIPQTVQTTGQAYAVAFRAEVATRNIQHLFLE